MWCLKALFWLVAISSPVVGLFFACCICRDDPPGDTFLFLVIWGFFTVVSGVVIGFYAFCPLLILNFLMSSIIYMAKFS